MNGRTQEYFELTKQGKLRRIKLLTELALDMKLADTPILESILEILDEELNNE